MKEQVYPLTWPKDWPRTTNPTTSSFKTSLSGALGNVEDSLKKFAKDSGKRIENYTLSSNVTLGAQNPKDSGVAIYFTWDGISTCIAVDRYQKVQDNLQAIHHVLEAERTKMRHGGLNLVRAAFRGYAALPPPSSKVDHWSTIFNLPKHSGLEIIEKVYKTMAKESHPDNGGSHERMAILNAAIAQARKEKS